MPPAIHTNSSAIYGIVHIDERASGGFKVLFRKLFEKATKSLFTQTYPLSLYNLVWEQRKSYVYRQPVKVDLTFSKVL